MIKNLPSDLFIKAFEKKVAAVQQEIDRSRAMERPYNAVKQALERVNLPNATELSFFSSFVQVRVGAVPEDRLATLEELVKAIGGELRTAELHGDGEPAKELGGYWHHIKYTWQMRPRGTHLGSVLLSIDLPAEGIADVEVETITETSESFTYRLRTVPMRTFAAPANMRTVSEEILF